MALNGEYTAGLTTPVLSVGSHTITATFSGDNLYQPATSNTIDVTVAPAATQVAVMTVPMPRNKERASVHLAVAVSPVAPLGSAHRNPDLRDDRPGQGKEGRDEDASAGDRRPGRRRGDIQDQGHAPFAIDPSPSSMAATRISDHPGCGWRAKLRAMFWAMANHVATDLTFSRPRTMNCPRPRLRAWALTHSAVAALSL